MQKNNIVLIGMPGAGKSTVGVLLAKATGLDFLDTDLLIQSEEGRSLPRLIETMGYRRFREMEESYILALQCKKTVIATGGSVVYSSDAMAHLAENGKIVYLSASFESINNRVSDMGERGVVRKPGQTLKELFYERRPLYSHWAEISVPTEGLNQQQVLDAILNFISPA